ncbi:hypothetical protein ACMC5O_001850 [Sphingomonas sediminicola]|uniref:hypothetical protein n=1 Tax=Sphingomonas sediminicola TaxID=386874 RepID=UPI003CFA3999
MSLVAAALFQQAIGAFATNRGWDQILISGWQEITNLGLQDVVVFAFFTLGGATLALWVEFWLRDRREAKARQEQLALSSTAYLRFSEDNGEPLVVELGEQSENVSYFAWYVNNGGTRRNEATMIFVEFEKEIPAPAVVAHSGKPGEWREIASTDRFAFVELKGWPDGEVTVQAVDSKALGLDRRHELLVWRSYAPVD